MPYGMPGGDTPAKDKWMETCVTAIKGTNKRTGQPYTEGEKIAICKAQYMKNHSSETIEIDKDILNRIDLVALSAVNKIVSSGKARTTVEAQSIYSGMLEKSGYDLDAVELLISKNL